MGIEENHDLILVAADRVLGCFLGRVFGHWNSRGDVLVVLPSCARLPLHIRLRSSKKIRAFQRKPYCRFFLKIWTPKIPCGYREVTGWYLPGIRRKNKGRLSASGVFKISERCGKSAGVFVGNVSVLQLHGVPTNLSSFARNSLRHSLLLCTCPENLNLFYLLIYISLFSSV
jgi:hypothetical protein